jgi:hypothetical protein
MKSLTSRASLRYPVSGRGTGASSFLDFRHRICYGARGQDGFREATREEERRRAPHRGEVVPIGSPCEQRRTCWGSERLHYAPGPQPFLTGRAIRVPHQGSIPVPSGQPRSHLGHRRAGRPRRTSKNASRECAWVESPRRAASGPGVGLGQATWAGSKVTLWPCVRAGAPAGSGMPRCADAPGSSRLPGRCTAGCG